MERGLLVKYLETTVTVSFGFMISIIHLKNILSKHSYSLNKEKLKKKKKGPKYICGTVEFKSSLLFSKQKDDDIEEGDLPEHKRPPAPIDFSKIDPGKPESILKLTKKGKTLMMFVTVSGNPTEKETEEITSLWQGSLFNANYDVQR